MADKISKNFNISNRRAGFEYFFLEKYEAGIVLTGTEIKSIREGKVNLQDAYCLFLNDELLSVTFISRLIPKELITIMNRCATGNFCSPAASSGSLLQN